MDSDRGRHRSNRRKVPCGVVAVLAALLAMPMGALGVVPGEISYQGLLLDDQGQPVTGAVDLSFALFDVPSGGAALWSESHPAVPVTDGVYDVTLGATSPIDAALVAGGAVYLEVTVDTEVMTPRQRLLAVPYALRAEVAETAESIQGQSGDYFTAMLQSYAFDGNGIGNLDPREGLGDVDGDGTANFLDPDNDGDGLSDAAEVSAGSDMNLPTPVIASFSPPTSDGFTPSDVTVNGSNFVPGLTVAFGGQSPTPTGLTSTSFTVSLAPESPGTVPVTVTRPNGESDTASYDFFYYQPTITSFSPPSSDGFTPSPVTVYGTNFSNGLTVSFGGQSPTPTNLTSTSFDVSLAPEPPGTVPVTVTLANGNSALASYDFFYYQPVIDTVVPAMLPDAAPGSFDLTGQNFVSGMTVELGSETAVLSALTATSVTASYSGAHYRLEDVTVTLPNGESTTSVGAIFFGGPKRIFTSTLQYDGDLGGLAGADALCDQLAQDASLGGTFQAWLGAGSTGPADRTERQGKPYQTTTGTVVADDWADLTDGSLDAPVNVDQYGSPVASSYYAWTNVSAVGGGAEGSADCSGWTSADPGDDGAYGVTGVTAPTWTDSVVVACDALNHLICIEE